MSRHPVPAIPEPPISWAQIKERWLADKTKPAPASLRPEPPPEPQTREEVKPSWPAFYGVLGALGVIGLVCIAIFARVAFFR
jgi:hypothetical protein